MGRTSPVVAQFEFAARVRKRREELGLPAATVSKHCGFTRNFYSAVENSRSLLATAKLPLLIEALQFDETDAQTLTTLLEQARTPGWWQPYASSASNALVQYLGLEAAASSIRSYENFVFHGLLQSREYAESVIAAGLNTSTVAMKRSLELRMRRQAELFESPPAMTMLMGEAVLHQQFGGRDVLKRQLEHVLTLAERLDPKLRLAVRPFASTPVGLHTSSTLVILDFDLPLFRPLAYREAGESLGVTADPDVVDRLVVHFDHALASSSDHFESIALITERINLL